MSRSSLPPQSTPLDATSGYDLWSQTYDDNASTNPMLAMVDWLLDQHPLTVQGQDVVELGCGTVRNIRRILEGGAKSYLGVDGSKGMLDEARARARDPRVSFALGELNAPLALSEGSADFILITLVLEHLETVDKLLVQAAKILRSGGKIRILELHAGLIERGVQAHFWHEGRQILLASYAHSPDEFRGALQAAGLSLQAIQEWPAPQDLVAKLPKLGKHGGRNLLLEVVASKSLPRQAP